MASPKAHRMRSTPRSSSSASSGSSPLLLTAILVGGKVAMWCVVAVGLFTSVGWSNTFSLALEGTGVYKSQVSSLLVMAILGGAILTPLQGYIADRAGLQISFIVPLIVLQMLGIEGFIHHVKRVR